MAIAFCTAPGSWGVEAPDDPGNPPWEAVLDEVAAAGFDGVELGPVGYLPERSAMLSDALRARSLTLAAGFVMEPLHDADAGPATLERTRRTCAALAAGGARRLVVIAALVPARSQTAGRSADAPRLDDAAWATLVATVDAVAAVAGEHGLTASFHPHAGTAVEFADEVERLLRDVDPAVGLCVDTGHAVYAGIDPVELLREHGARVGHLHLKDVPAAALAAARAQRLSFEQAVAAGVFCPLGEGTVDFVAVRDALVDVGFDGWATFEQDRLPGDGRALADARASLEHLRAVGLGAPAAQGSPR